MHSFLHILFKNIFFPARFPLYGNNLCDLSSLTTYLWNLKMWTETKFAWVIVQFSALISSRTNFFATPHFKARNFNQWDICFGLLNCMALHAFFFIGDLSLLPFDFLSYIFPVARSNFNCISV